MTSLSKERRYDTAQHVRMRLGFRSQQPVLRGVQLDQNAALAVVELGHKGVLTVRCKTFKAQHSAPAKLVGFNALANAVANGTQVSHGAGYLCHVSTFRDVFRTHQMGKSLRSEKSNA